MYGYGVGIYSYGEPYGDERYEGEFRDGWEHGRGTMTWGRGGRYQGGWRNGRPHEYGTYTSRDGERLEGEWRDGCFTREDGSIPSVREPFTACTGITY